MAIQKGMLRADSPYGEHFYAAKNEGSYRSAMAILPLMFSIVNPRSVVDVGCGTGTWLRAADELGAREYQGYDGWQPSRLYIPREQFAVADLTQPLRPARRFDLAICCEVAEHLPPECAETLVATLSSFSDVVLFSAAIPGQGGKHHRNEQWPGYWQARFQAQGYSAYDCIRGRIWSEERVEWWYRQNIILYVADSAASRFALPAPTPEVPALVHPLLYEAQRRKRVVRNFLRGAKQAIARLTQQRR